jgi:ADP-ribose pyrophosphatase
VYRGRIVHLTVERLTFPGGHQVDLEVVLHPGAAAVVPVDADGQVLMVRQYRHATGGWLLEAPAGKLDAGEPPEACARREVEEETGHRPGRLEPLGWIWTTPGFSDERIWLYLATDLVPGRQGLEPDEWLEVVRLPLAEAAGMAAAGEITDAKTVCALLRAARRLGLS